MRPSTQVLKDSFDYFKQHIETFLGIYIISISVMLIGVYVFHIPAELTDDTDPSLIAPYAVMIIVSIIVQVLSYGATIYASALGNEATLQNAYSHTLRKLPSLLILSLLIGLIIMVGLLLLIIPGIIFSLWLMCATAVFLLENKGMLESMRVSKKLVENRLGKMFSYVLLNFGVLLLTVVIVTIMVTTLSLIIPMNDLAIELLNYILFFPVSAISYIYFYQVYLEFRRTYVDETVPVPTSTV